MSKLYFKTQITKIFGTLSFYKEDVEARQLSFTLEDNGISFDQLEKLAKLLQTTHINFSGTTDPLSEVTLDSVYEGQIDCAEVNFVLPDNCEHKWSFKELRSVSSIYVCEHCPAEGIAFKGTGGGIQVF